MNRTIGIITALERELHPLVEAGGWARTNLVSSRSLTCYELGRRVVVAGGIGSKQAEAATRAVVEKYHPQILISAGLAGALIPSLKVGSIVTPNVIVDASTGAEYRCRTSTTETLRHGENGANRTGEGACATPPCRLVSASEVAGPQSKADLAERFHALAVDMEAAGVARVAHECNAGFLCVKAISDEFDFAMPPLNSFVDGEGNFKTGSFAAWTALRPRHWSKVLDLSRNSARALRVLAAWLAQNTSGSLDAGAVVTLEHVP